MPPVHPAQGRAEAAGGPAGGAGGHSHRRLLRRLRPRPRGAGHRASRARPGRGCWRSARRWRRCSCWRGAPRAPSTATCRSFARPSGTRHRRVGRGGPSRAQSPARGPEARGAGARHRLPGEGAAPAGAPGHLATAGVPAHHHDPLTGLANRKTLEERLESALASARSLGRHARPRLPGHRLPAAHQRRFRPRRGRRVAAPPRAGAEVVPARRGAPRAHRWRRVLGAHRELQRRLRAADGAAHSRRRPVVAVRVERARLPGGRERGRGGHHAPHPEHLGDLQRGRQRVLRGQGAGQEPGGCLPRGAKPPSTCARRAAGG